MEQRIARVPDIPIEVADVYLLISTLSRELFRKKVVQHVDPFEGKLIPNCHAVARAYARAFPQLSVHDGGFTQFIGGRPRVYYHSWVSFKSHPYFLIDLVPLAAVPYLSGPNLLYRDAWCYLEEFPLAPKLFAGIATHVDLYFRVIGELVLELKERKETSA